MAQVVKVFSFEGRGGNPCPIVLDAAAMTPAEMQALAAAHGHESGFVLPASSDDFDFALRFWVPNHEMEMCGHATLGALWLLAATGRIGGNEVRIETRSGAVTGFLRQRPDGGPDLAITQPAGRVRPLDAAAEGAVLAVLGLSRGDLAALPLQNAATSRVKTLVPVKDVARLNALQPDFEKMEGLCREIGSSGLYPYAVRDLRGQVFDARQFPRASGYPEDAATGVAAAALAFGLLRNGLAGRDGKQITVMQGRAMGRLSQIFVQLGFAGDEAIGCLLGGAVTPAGEGT